MFQIKNFTDNDDIRILENRGAFTTVEYLRDLSVTPSSAQNAYFCNEMNVRRRQVICALSKADVTRQSGGLQETAGKHNPPARRTEQKMLISEYLRPFPAEPGEPNPPAV